MHGLRLGSQRPTWSLEPDTTDLDWEISELAIDWAKAAGYTLDDWQQWLTRWAFARRPDGLWAARDYVMEVPRQNGKNIVLEVIELFAVVMLGEDLVIHSAHRTDVSHEHFLSMKAAIEASPMLLERMPSKGNGGFYTVNGRESIELANGNRILFKSRQGGSGRGPRPKRLVFDEALILPTSAVGDMAPGMSAQRNAQIVFASSPPAASSEMLHLLRHRATTQRDETQRMFYAAWNNSPDVDVDDRDAWYRVNPSLGYGRVTEESLRANRQLMTHEDYVREHLGVPEAPASESGPISAERWESLTDGESLPDGPVRLCLDVQPSRMSAVFGIAGRRSDGLWHGSVRLEVPPPDMPRLVELAKQLTDGHDATLILPPGPARSWRAQLDEAGVPLDDMSPAEYAEACGAILAAINDGTFRHRGQVLLNAAVGGLATRASGDVETWSRRSSSSNISPFVAVTCAFGRVPAKPQPAKKRAQAWARVG